MEHLPKWVLPVAIGLGLLYFLSRRGRAVGSASGPIYAGGGTPFGGDVSRRQQQAEDLAFAEQKKQYAYQDALRGLELNVRGSQAQAAIDYGTFYHDLSTGQKYAGGYRCPGGGKPRIDPATGSVVCMNTNQSKGFFAPFVDTVQKAANAWLGYEIGAPPTGKGGRRF